MTTSSSMTNGKKIVVVNSTNQPMRIIQNEGRLQLMRDSNDRMYIVTPSKQQTSGTSQSNVTLQQIIPGNNPRNTQIVTQVRQILPKKPPSILDQPPKVVTPQERSEKIKIAIVEMLGVPKNKSNQSKSTTVEKETIVLEDSDETDSVDEIDGFDSSDDEMETTSTPQIKVSTSNSTSTVQGSIASTSHIYSTSTSTSTNVSGLSTPQTTPQVSNILKTQMSSATSFHNTASASIPKTFTKPTQSTISNNPSPTVSNTNSKLRTTYLKDKKCVEYQEYHANTIKINTTQSTNVHATTSTPIISIKPSVSLSKATIEDTSTANRSDDSNDCVPLNNNNPDLTRTKLSAPIVTIEKVTNKTSESTESDTECEIIDVIQESTSKSNKPCFEFISANNVDCNEPDAVTNKNDNIPNASPTSNDIPIILNSYSEAVQEVDKNKSTTNRSSTNYDPSSSRSSRKNVDIPSTSKSNRDSVPSTSRDTTYAEASTSRDTNYPAGNTATSIDIDEDDCLDFYVEESDSDYEDFYYSQRPYKITKLSKKSSENKKRKLFEIKLFNDLKLLLPNKVVTKIQILKGAQETAEKLKLAELGLNNLKNILTRKNKTLTQQKAQIGQILVDMEKKRKEKQREN